MRSLAKRLLAASASLAVAIVATGCGSEQINVPKSKGSLYHGAVLFNQRCAGCHTLSYAATHGSAANVRTAQYNNGPNFDVRCERPITRVLYAIANGGFSGAYMPQNVVVGQEAIDVAKFVSTYAGRQAPKVPGSPSCDSKPVGTIPSLSGTGTTTTTSHTTPTPTAVGRKAGTRAKRAARHKSKRKP